jgi:hypothetical protein
MTEAQALLAPVLSGSGSTFASYSSQIYFTKYKTGRDPEITTDLDKLEASAKSILPSKAYQYAARGCGRGKTMQANLDAFDRVCVHRRFIIIKIFNKR